MTSFGYFLFCFAIIFGPKFGVIDFSVLLPVFLLPSLLGHRSKIPKQFLLLTAMLMALICYQILVQIVNQNIEFEAIGRLARALITTIVVGLMFGAGGLGFGKKIFRALLLAIVFHAMLIVIAALFYPVNELLSIISGNDRVREYRASGLMAGFDIAGLLSIIGIAMIVFRVNPIKHYFVNVIFLFILFFSCYFASRVSMAISVILLLVYIVGILRRSEISMYYRVVIFLLFGYVVYKVAYSAIAIFDVTFSLGFMEIDTLVTADIVSRYAAQYPSKFLWSDMFIIPKSDWQLIFGSGGDVLESDIGYVKEIFRYGIVGLVFALLSHICFILKNFGKHNSFQLNSRGLRLVAFVFIIMLILTFKNNYIFVRGVFPVFLILIAAVAYDLRDKDLALSQ